MGPHLLKAWEICLFRPVLRELGRAVVPDFESFLDKDRGAVQYFYLSLSRIHVSVPLGACERHTKTLRTFWSFASTRSPAIWSLSVDREACSRPRER